jgi:hypothetical protein
VTCPEPVVCREKICPECVPAVCPEKECPIEDECEPCPDCPKPKKCVCPRLDKTVLVRNNLNSEKLIKKLD